MPFTNPDTPPDNPATGVREFQADFETGTEFKSNTSTVRRPDAVSSDYLTTFSLGPVAIADVTEGAVAKVWRARLVNNELLLNRANDANDGWDDDISLFTLDPSVNVQEIDLAFEQQGRAVVCMEADGRVLLYWFDTVDSTFKVTDWDAGRTPRVLLDNPSNPDDSDVLFFYISDVDNLLVYRAQRDRYATVYNTPQVTTTSHYLEDVFRTPGNRLICLMTLRGTDGRYTKIRLESTLYPFVLDPEDLLDFGMLALDGEIIVVVITYDTPFDELDYGMLAVDGLLVLPIIDAEAVFDELDYGISALSGTIVLPIIDNSPDNEPIDWGVTFSATATTLVVVIITHTLFDTDQLNWGVDLRTGGTLAP